ARDCRPAAALPASRRGKARSRLLCSDRCRCGIESSVPILLRMFCEVFKKIQSAFTRDGEIEIAVAIEVENRDLHAAARACAVVEHVARPDDLAVRSFERLIPVDAE